MARASRSKRSRNCGSPASCGGQNLDGDDAVEPRIAGFEHLAHAARAEGGLNFIRAEASAGRQSHRRMICGLYARGRQESALLRQ